MTIQRLVWLLASVLLITTGCIPHVFEQPTPVPETLHMVGVTQIVPPPKDLAMGRVYWSPDSTQLAFAYSRTGMEQHLSLPPKYQILTINIQSGEIKMIEESNYDRDVFAWLPDGRIAIFASGDLDEGAWLMNADGNGPKEFLINAQIIWSPDGERIAFKRYNYNTQTKISSISILLRDFIGDNGQEIFESEGRGINLDLLQWSPNENKILFIFYDGTAEYLYTVDFASKKATKLSQQGLYGSASWSPDGTLITYTHRKALTVDEHVMLYIMRSDGSCPIQLTPPNNHDIGWAMWSPDGKWIAFTWNGGIYLLDTSQIANIELLKNGSPCP